MDIYEQLYKRLNFLIKESKNEMKTEMSYETNNSETLDMFSESVDDKMFSVADNVKQDKPSNENDANNTLLSKDDEVMWEFKWENEENAAIYGPHPSSEMLRWVEEGYFEKGVWVRKVGQNSDFYNSRRIDFDLYV
ncbi:CD2 antigen cytoplasmic tail-binding protein 2 homolog [Centruroides sculpturatus]|uniref:CD2 antigen cytoplasmic tail-binding protein 2 homolog n=1 Tax=Centruroides sculpturatus TaxID=218467 RepID=UPI000C6E4BFA|nr:CD2 antigen cytoplasmic tail-binding protein 2 homolog [Centruroides sculpturatus]